MTAVAQDSVEGILEGFRSSRAVEAPDCKTYQGEPLQHPMVIASHNYVEAESELATARVRLITAQKELSAAEDDVTAKEEVFEKRKAQLAGLLK